MLWQVANKKRERPKWTRVWLMWFRPWVERYPVEVNRASAMYQAQFLIVNGAYVQSTRLCYYLQLFRNHPPSTSHSNAPSHSQSQNILWEYVFTKIVRTDHVGAEQFILPGSIRERGSWTQAPIGVSQTELCGSSYVEFISLKSWWPHLHSNYTTHPQFSLLASSNSLSTPSLVSATSEWSINRYGINSSRREARLNDCRNITDRAMQNTVQGCHERTFRTLIDTMRFLLPITRL